MRALSTIPGMTPPTAEAGAEARVQLDRQTEALDLRMTEATMDLIHEVGFIPILEYRLIITLHGYFLNALALQSNPIPTHLLSVSHKLSNQRLSSSHSLLSNKWRKIN